MTTEKFANLAETSLTATYLGGGGVITVSDPSLFPTAGLFRIRLGNIARTILIVTAVAGSSFTTLAEFNDGTAPIGTAIVLVATRGSHERFLQSPEVDEIRSPSGISAADFYGPLFKWIALDQSAWTWFNQGSAVVNQQNGLVSLLAPSVGGTNILGRLRGSYPSTPFTLIVGLMPFFQSAGVVQNINLLGIVLSDGTKFKIFDAANFNISNGSPPSGINVGNYNTATSFNSVAANTLMELPNIVWLKMVDDGANLTFSFSYDKTNWVQLLQHARTTFLTPSDIGIVVTNQSGGILSGGDIVSWELT